MAGSGAREPTALSELSTGKQLRGGVLTKSKRTFGFLIALFCLGTFAITIQFLRSNETVSEPATGAGEERPPQLDAQAEAAPPLSVGELEGMPPVRDFNQFRELLAAGKMPGFPKDVNDMSELAVAEKKRQQAVLEAEESSRSELKRLASCFSPNLFKMSGQGQSAQQQQIPAELAKQLPLMVQSSCLSMAQRIVDKYPKFRREFEKEILAKAKPEAVKMAREQAPL